jgi:hypothetical protein
MTEPQSTPDAVPTLDQGQIGPLVTLLARAELQRRKRIRHATMYALAIALQIIGVLALAYAFDTHKNFLMFGEIVSNRYKNLGLYQADMQVSDDAR